jgi:hypothetical protein
MCKCHKIADVGERCNINSKNWNKCKSKLETVLYHILNDHKYKKTIDDFGIDLTFKSPYISHAIITRFNLKPREYKELVNLFLIS